MALVPTCVWRCTPELVVRLEDRLGDPTDTYVNGSVTWLRPDGPRGEILEWRLHPVPGFRRPAGVAHTELFARVVWAVRAGEPPPAPPCDLWEGLEAFPAYGDEIEPAVLRAAVADTLGIPPVACGLVDHERIAARWERTRGRVAVVTELLDQLGLRDGTT